MEIDITMFGQIIGGSEMAIYFKPRDYSEAVWLPRSLIAIVKGVGGVYVTIPVWLAKEKGIY